MKLRTCCITTSTSSRCGTRTASMPLLVSTRSRANVKQGARRCPWACGAMVLRAIGIARSPWKYLRLPLTGVSSKNVSTHTFADVLGVVAWSFQCLASGRFPSHRHDGAPMDSKRAKMAGQTLGVQGVLAEVKGDWKFMKDNFGFPSWNTNSGICWLCDCTPQTLRDVGHDAPWRVNRRSHWDLLACVARGSHAICPIFGAPWLRSSCFKIDWLHCSEQGVAADFMGGVFFHVIKGTYVPGTN